MSKSSHELALETRLAQLAPDLPPAQREYRFMAGRKYRFDFAWPHPNGGGVAAECDGGSWAPGGGRHNRDSDRWKMSYAASLGYVVLRFSGEMIASDPARCVELIRAALERAGLLPPGGRATKKEVQVHG